MKANYHTTRTEAAALSELTVALGVLAGLGLVLAVVSYPAFAAVSATVALSLAGVKYRTRYIDHAGAVDVDGVDVYLETSL